MKPQRIQLKRTRGWRIPSNTVKVDRTTRYGNPIKVGGTVRVEANGSMYDAAITPAVAVEFFREYIAGALRTHPELLTSLRGKNAACWCHLCEKHAAGKPWDVKCHDCATCHADVLLEIANR